MKRALLAVLVAAPAATLAQTAGQIVFDPTEINKADCDAANATIALDWSTSITTTAGSFTTGGTYEIFASTRSWDASDDTDDEDFCDTTSGTGWTAGLVGDTFSATSQVVTNRSVNVQDILGAVEVETCDANKKIYVCVHWFDSSNTRSGFAHSVLELSVLAPGAPVLDSVVPGDGRLHVGWTAPSSSGAEVDHYKIQATNPADTGEEPHWSGELGTTSGEIDGLTNGVTYDVVVFAYTDSDNQSEASNIMTGTPQPVDDYWDHYQDAGGQERGGCATGAAGALALLGAAGVLAIRRRKP
jgi:MYXO-CTERM domain-containing protein